MLIVILQISQKSCFRNSFHYARCVSRLLVTPLCKQCDTEQHKTPYLLVEAYPWGITLFDWYGISTKSTRIPFTRTLAQLSQKWKSVFTELLASSGTKVVKLCCCFVSVVFRAYSCEFITACNTEMMMGPNESVCISTGKKDAWQMNLLLDRSCFRQVLPVIGFSFNFCVHSLN